MTLYPELRLMGRKEMFVGGDRNCARRYDSSILRLGTAFFFVGIPGLLLGLSAMRLPEPPRDRSEEHMHLRELLRVPAYLAVLVAGWFSSFAGYTCIA
jgi:hypothetical protein